eukprot:1153109-Pelagomonas_calceolata.AAC.12
MAAMGTSGMPENPLAGYSLICSLTALLHLSPSEPAESTKDERGGGVALFLPCKHSNTYFYTREARMPETWPLKECGEPAPEKASVAPLTPHEQSACAAKKACCTMTHIVNKIVPDFKGPSLGDSICGPSDGGPIAAALSKDAADEPRRQEDDTMLAVDGQKILVEALPIGDPVS